MKARLRMIPPKPVSNSTSRYTRALSPARTMPEPVAPAPLVGHAVAGDSEAERDHERICPEQDEEEADGGGGVAEHHRALQSLGLRGVEPASGLGHRVILAGPDGRLRSARSVVSRW